MSDWKEITPNKYSVEFSGTVEGEPESGMTEVKSITITGAITAAVRKIKETWPNIALITLNAKQL